MRTKRLLDALLPETRQRVLATLLCDASREWYVRELAAHLRVSPSSLPRELTSLAESGVLLRREEGRRSYFRANPECPVFPELLRIMLKTAGLVDVLRHALDPLKKRIEVAFVYGSLARGTEVSESDVDLMVIGNVGLADLAPLLRKPQQELSRPINPVVMPPTELRKRASRTGFIRAALDEEKLFVVGGSRELEEVSGRAPS